MAVHWNAAGTADGTVAKPAAILLMPATVVTMSFLFEATGSDADGRVVGSVAMLLLLVVQIMVFLINLGVDVPLVPIALASSFCLVALAVWFEIR